MERIAHKRLVKIIASAALVVTAGIWIFRDAIFQGDAAYEAHVGSVIPDALLTDVTKKETKLSELFRANPGDKAVLVLWATWCEPCVRELPLIAKTLVEYGKLGIQVHLVNYDGPLPEKSIPEVKAWFISQGIGLSSNFEFAEELLTKLDISALPFAIGVDAKTSRIVWMHMGELAWDRPEEIKKLF